VKAVLFDIDDTLFPTSEFARLARLNAVRAMIDAGLEHTDDEVLEELQEVLVEFSSNYGQHFDQLLKRLRPPSCNPALVIAAGVAAYHDTKFREIAPFPDVIPTLGALRSRGLITAVVTHGRTVKQAEKLVRLGLAGHFDAVFISEQIGISKPNPKLYLVALDGLGVAPEEAIYIGDNPRHDIVPAQSIGMVAIWARRASKYPLDGVEPDHIIDDFSQVLAHV